MAPELPIPAVLLGPEPAATTRVFVLRGVRGYLRDVQVVTGRNLTLMRRDPVSLVFLTVQPIIFVLLFRFVFGQALELVIGIAYIQYLMPGIFAQTVCFGAMGTGVGLASDLSTGMVERFRSLPMAPSAVLVGRTLADLVRNVWVVFLMFLVGTLLGFEIWGSKLDFVAMVGLLLLMGFALSWVFALLGLSGRPERVFAISFPILIPLVFLSSAFVPVGLLPDWAATFANHQPVSQTIEAMRHVAFGGYQPEYVVNSLLSSVGIIAVAAGISIWRFRRAD